MSEISSSNACSSEPERFRDVAIAEAINTLCLVTPEAFEDLRSALDQCFPTSAGFGGLHPRQVCLTMRKDGEQLSLDQKRSLGLRASAFMSARLASQLAPDGLRAPLEAHLSTLLRALFSALRYERIRSSEGPNVHAEYEVGHLDCPGCSRLSGKSPSDHGVVLPPTDCLYDRCLLGVRTRVRW